MALKKTKNLPNGTSGEYWRITQISANRNTGIVSYELSLYISKAAKLAGVTPLNYKKLFNFPATMLQMNGDLNAYGYANIKTKANTPIPDAFSPLQIKPTIPGDLDLVDADDI